MCEGERLDRAARFMSGSCDEIDDVCSGDGASTFGRVALIWPRRACRLGGGFSSPNRVSISFPKAMTLVSASTSSGGNIAGSEGDGGT